MCERIRHFGICTRTNGVPDYERTVSLLEMVDNSMSLLEMVDNSMSLLAILVEALCCQQRTSICLHFWVGKRCTVNKIGASIGPCHSLHIVSNTTALFFYVGKEHNDRPKRAYLQWSIEEEVVLKELLKENAHLPIKELAHYFYSNVSMCHSIDAIQAKLHSLQSKDSNVGKQAQTSIQLFLKAIEDTQTIACSICARLMFAKSIKSMKSSTQNKANPTCKTCHKNSKNEEPNYLAILGAHTFSLSIPVVAPLNSIEALLISIRIPFAQIRQLTHNISLGLRGTVVNVMADLDRARIVLPRLCELESMILVGIKRKLAYSHTYLAGLVRPLLIMSALGRLIQEPLYIENQVLLNDEWLTHIDAL